MALITLHGARTSRRELMVFPILGESTTKLQTRTTKRPRPPPQSTGLWELPGVPASTCPPSGSAAGGAGPRFTLVLERIAVHMAASQPEALARIQPAANPGRRFSPGRGWSLQTDFTEGRKAQRPSGKQPSGFRNPSRKLLIASQWERRGVARAS